MIKKFASATIAAGMILVSLTGCGNTAPNIATYKGSQGFIPAGVYIYTQNSALQNYSKYMSSNNILKEKLDGKTVKDIITEDSKDAMKRIAAVECEFERLDLPFDEEDAKQADLNTSDIFDDDKSGLEAKGISRNSILELSRNNIKSYKLFENYYNEGGEYEVTTKEKEDYISANYKKTTFIDFSYKTTEGKMLEGKALEDQKKKAHDYFDSIEKGDKEFFDVYKEMAKEREQEVAENETEKSRSAILKISDTRFPKEFVMKVFSTTELDKPIFFECDDFAMIFKVYDILENNFVEGLGSNVLYEMKGDEFKDLLLKKGNEEIEFKFDDNALKDYSIEKIQKR